MHTQEGVADMFLDDIKATVAELMINPEKPVEGKVMRFRPVVFPKLDFFLSKFQMAVYGVAQTIPDRALVGDFTRCFLNAMYYTPRVRSSDIVLK